MEPNLAQKLPAKAVQDVAECSNAWMLYLQSLAGVCAAGARVSASLQVLATNQQLSNSAGNCRNAWEELSRASQAAGHSVRAEVMAGLRELASEDHFRNDQIVQSNLATMINLQYQFCIACVECLGNISQQDNSQQVSPCSDVGRQSQIFSRLLSGQRRWSEVARRPAADREEDCEEGGTVRRWSVPWESTSVVVASHHHQHLTVPGQERSSRSTTPDTSSSLASQEELHDVISLLSLKPANPGPQNAKPGHWPHTTYSDNVDSGSQNMCQIRINTSPRISHLPRPRSGWTPQESLYSTIWGEQDSENQNGPADRSEMFIPNDGNGTPYHRKSSSSTDSSSSSSLPQHQIYHHNQLLLEQQQLRESPLYSMWSGNDVPLIHIPSGSSAGQPMNQDLSQQPTNSRPD
ncbi:uncharacterized protein LOC132194539 isoform X2 [Neocloeon triangulifer]|uniref:uncharacterized protein LOC132194539 isoform X2 n=1 Tax=Neocloeon triangulifer TaxID=2078957 RepID=UPI00286EC7B3|nr:uncharacterized protein LOC132194539 isoform X2 [Neocloeon triangulifer]